MQELFLQRSKTCLPKGENKSVGSLWPMDPAAVIDQGVSAIFFISFCLSMLPCPAVCFTV